MKKAAPFTTLYPHISEWVLNNGWIESKTERNIVGFETSTQLN